MRETERLRFGRLGGPPRGLGFGTRAALLADSSAFGASVAFAVFGAVAVALVLSARPVDRLRLALDRREAPGTVVSAEKTNVKEGNRPVYGLTFTFRTPDGVERSGNCHVLGGRVGGFKLKPGAAVTVEYAGDDPRAALVRGGRFGPLGLVFVVALSAPALGALGFVAAGVSRTARKAGLLRSGVAAEATLVGYVIKEGDGTREVAVGGPLQPSDRAVASGVADPGHAVALSVARGFLSFWTCGVAALLVLGTVFLVTMLVLTVMPGGIPMKINGGVASKGARVAFLVGFLVVWTASGVWMLRSGLAGLRTLAANSTRPTPTTGADDPAPPSALMGLGSIPLVYEIRPEGGGTPVRVTETAAVARVLTHEPEGPVGLPILYDPDEPAEALLLANLPGPLSVNDLGDWELTSGGLRLAARLVLMAACLAGGPALGGAAWRWFAT